MKSSNETNESCLFVDQAKVKKAIGDILVRSQFSARPCSLRRLCHKLTRECLVANMINSRNGTCLIPKAAAREYVKTVSSLCRCHSSLSHHIYKTPNSVEVFLECQNMVKKQNAMKKPLRILSIIPNEHMIDGYERLCNFADFPEIRA